VVVFQSHSCRESELLMLLELSGPAIHGDHQQQIINHMIEIRLKKKNQIQMHCLPVVIQNQEVH